MYCPPYIVRVNKSRRFKWVEHAVRLEARRSFNLIGKPSGLLGKPRYRWEDNIKMDLKEIGVDVMS